MCRDCCDCVEISLRYGVYQAGLRDRAVKRPDLAGERTDRFRKCCGIRCCVRREPGYCRGIVIEGLAQFDDVGAGKGGFDCLAIAENLAIIDGGG